MPDTRNLELRGATWWCYRTVPPSLRGLIGKRTLRRSLGTRDLKEAVRLRPLAMADFAQQLEKARSRAASTSDPIADKALAWRQFSSRVVDSDGNPISPETAADLWSAQVANVAASYGSEAAERFEAITTTATFTPIDLYLAEYHRQSKVIPKSKAEQTTAIRRLMAWNQKLSLENLDRKTASRYIDQGLAFTTSPVTRNKHITWLSSYWRWLLRRGYVEQNPWVGQFLETVGRTGHMAADEQERPFTDAEMTALLSGPANPDLADAMRIAALSGLRINEIAMLRVRDSAEGWFVVTKAKTRASLRRVPIHSSLQRLVDLRRQNKDQQAFLFHELGPEPAADAITPRGDLLGKRFATYRKSLKIQHKIAGKRRSLVNFHSFRRWFITKAEQAGQPPWIIEAIAGHRRSGESLGTYSGGPSDIQLKDCVEAIKLS